MNAAAIDWGGLLRLGLGPLQLQPAAFWALTPRELQLMLGKGAESAPLTRARLAELAAAYPDHMGRDA